MSVCLCHAVHPMKVEPQLIILQHPKEVDHAKNSARLVQLAVPQARVLIGESPEDFLPHLADCLEHPDHVAVFYPSPSSKPMESHLADFRRHNYKHLIFVDATWRKAFKLWQLNPWLQALTCWCFAAPPPSRYQIRKAKVENSLSTLEAVAYALEQGFGVDPSGFFNLFDAMQQTQLRHRP